MDSIGGDHSVHKRDVIMVKTKHSSPSLEQNELVEEGKIVNLLTKEVKFGQLQAA